jgi:hypothetical protein
MRRRFICSALLVATTMALALAPVMEAAQEGSAGRIVPAASIFRADPAFRLDPPDTDERWARLGRLSSKATVTVDLRDGRVLEGTIHAVRTGSLDFVASRDDGAGGVLQFTPQEIQRIRQSVRWRMKFLGAAVGLVAGIVVDASRKDSDAPPVSGIMLAVAGFYVAPLIRSEKTLWEHPTRRP